MFIEKLRNLWAKTRNTPQGSRDDAGFSFAQVIVTMVIVGILGGAIGFTAFEFIGQSRETVLAANVRTAAEAVQNTLALNPNLKKDVAADTGQAPAVLIGELANAAGFDWKTTGATSAQDGWVFDLGDGAETVHIQFLGKATAAGAVRGTTATPPTDAESPKANWMIENGDAVRLHAQNDDGAWACALVVFRPNYTLGTAIATVTAEAVEANLRGIWYDAGSTIELDGLHHCSPVNVTAQTISAANIAAGHPAGTTNEPLPASGSEWTIPAETGIDARTLQRTVPAFTE